MYAKITLPKAAAMNQREKARLEKYRARQARKQKAKGAAKK